MTKIWLVEVDGVNPNTGLTETHRWATSPGYNHPSAPGYYPPHVVQPANIERHAVADGKTYGANSVSFGLLEIKNQPKNLLSAGPYDFLIDYGLDGQTCRILSLSDHRLPYSSAVVELNGSVWQPFFDDAKNIMTLAYRDAIGELATANIQPNLFAGTNVGAVGVEGTTADIAKQPYPLAYGLCLNVTPQPANSTIWVYQLHWRQISAILNVYDKGSVVNVGVARASLAALMTNAPAAGTYDYYLGSGTDGAYIRLATNPQGTVTVDLRGDATGGVYVSTIADIFKRIMTTAPGLPGSYTVSAADITAANAANSAEVGIYIPTVTPIKAPLDKITASGGFVYGPDKLNVWRLFRVENPSGSPVATFKYFIRGVQTAPTDAKIISMERVALNDPSQGSPVFTVTGTYSQNNTVQQAGSLTGGLAAARQAVVALAALSATATDASVKTIHKLAQTMLVTTYLTTLTDAQNEMNRLLALYEVRRDRFKITTPMGTAAYAAIDVGKIVSIKIPRYNLGAGKLFLVLGIVYDALKNTAVIDVWG